MGRTTSFGPDPTGRLGAPFLPLRCDPAGQHRAHHLLSVEDNDPTFANHRLVLERMSTLQSVRVQRGSIHLRPDGYRSTVISPDCFLLVGYILHRWSGTLNWTPHSSLLSFTGGLFQFRPFYAIRE